MVRCEVTDSLRIGIIGDWDPARSSHVATNEALGHAANALGVALEVSWLPTPALDHPDGTMRLEAYDALWCAPGSPYESMEGALAAIRFARERDCPFIGT
jgi:CTP synthase (UTP-ammonia lyase)